MEMKGRVTMWQMWQLCYSCLQEYFLHYPNINYVRWPKTEKTCSSVEIFFYKIYKATTKNCVGVVLPRKFVLENPQSAWFIMPIYIFFFKN